LLVGEFELLCHVACKCGLGQSSCHVLFSLWASPQGCRVTGFHRMGGRDPGLP
jgi:hypothetical protein